MGVENAKRPVEGTWASSRRWKVGGQVKGSLRGWWLFLHLVKNWQINCWAHCQKMGNPLEMIVSNFSLLFLMRLTQPHLLYLLLREKWGFCLFCSSHSEPGTVCGSRPALGCCAGPRALGPPQPVLGDRWFVCLIAWVSPLLPLCFPPLSFPNTLLTPGQLSRYHKSKKQGNKSWIGNQNQNSLRSRALNTESWSF